MSGMRYFCASDRLLFGRLIGSCISSTNNFCLGSQNLEGLFLFFGGRPLNLIDVDESMPPILSLFYLHYFARNDLLDRVDFEKERVMLLLEVERMEGQKRYIEESVPTGLRQRLLAIDGRFDCKWLLEKLSVLYSFCKNISVYCSRRFFLLANIRSVKLLGTSKSIFNKLLHFFGIAITDHLAIYFQF